MGRLKHYRANRRSDDSLRRHLIGWILPIALAAGVVLIISNGVKADYLPTTTELSQYLQSHSLDAYHQTVNDYQQVFYKYKDQQITVTTDGYNHTAVMSAGPYIVWQGLISYGSQIFIYNVLTQATLQLTTSGVNESPKVTSSGAVTWQWWDGQQWQVMYYGGQAIRQITDDPNSSSINPVTDGSKVVYAQQIADDDWKAFSYDLATGQTSVIREGDTASTAYPYISANGSVSTGFVVR